MARQGTSALLHQRSVEFWKESLEHAGDGFVLNGPPPEAGSREAGPRQQVERALGQGATDTLLKISQGGDLESFVVFHAAAALLLSRYEDSGACVTSIPPLQGTDSGWREGLPLVLSLEQVKNVRELVIATDQAIVDAYEHQGVPAALLPAGAAERAWSNVRLAHATLHAPLAPGQGVALALTLDLPASGSPVVRASFATDALARWFVKELLANLEHVLAVWGQASSLEKVELASFEVVRPASRTRLLEDFNREFHEDPSPSTLVARIRAQVARTPDAPAVISDGTRLSYAELDQRAEALAAHLANAHGIRRGDRVAILMGKSDLPVVAILGILKAGAAYVPVDPRIPPARVGFLLRDCGCRLLLTEATLLLSVEGFDGAVMALDVEPVPPAPPDDAPVPVAPEDLAYVIYTSGSTGEPKGVCITHAAILSYLDWKLAYYRFDSSFVLLQIPPLCFDSSVSDLFSMLLSGASMVLLPDEARLEVPLIRELVGRHKVTNLTLVPSHYRVLLEHLEPFREQLRVITIAGERSSLDLIQRHQRLLPSTRLINEYGPTENSVGATAYDYALGETDGGRVGFPQTNTRVRILDRQLRLLPHGAAGEICLSGPGVALGYLNREELTREVFVPDPFVAGARMYRSGDMGRWTPDGQLELLGRRDAQVKIRGNRVEPGEVEAALRRLPGVRESVVVARPNVREELELVAYAVTDGGQAPAALREALARVLPAAMVPSHVVVLGELPLLPSGKVDRSRLPAPSLAAGDAQREAPSDEVEALVASIWEEELRSGPVSLDADFFALGGHSLLGVQIVLRLQQALDVQVGLRELFENPTIRRFAGALRHKEKQRVRPIEPVPEAASYPASHAQRRIWILERLRGQGRAAYNLPDAYELDGTLGDGEVETALRRVVERHESLRTCFGEVAGELMQRVLPASAFSLERKDLGGLPGAEQALTQALRAEAERPFALESDPPFRATLYRLGEGQHVLGLQIHHIACDGWSAARFIREMLDGLAAGREGRDPGLKPLRIQYRDFVAWQEAALREGAWDAERRYWMEQLAGPREPLMLPTDFPRPASRRFEGRVVRMQLAPELGREIRAAGQRAGASLFMFLTAAVQALLYR
ncbi:MAG TPA: amino acid adenylation domain-containing protein, partial [Archangium sp.]|nr:amino acid adenylation domain-containing protein [Archangium sp.]